MGQKRGEADIRQMAKTKEIADLLTRVIPTFSFEPASKNLQTSPQKTVVTSGSVTNNPVIPLNSREGIPGKNMLIMMKTKMETILWSWKMSYP